MFARRIFVADSDVIATREVMLPGNLHDIG
jgi:hypothetical protein